MRPYGYLILIVFRHASTDRCFPEASSIAELASQLFTGTKMLRSGWVIIQHHAQRAQMKSNPRIQPGRRRQRRLGKEVLDHLPPLVRVATHAPIRPEHRRELQRSLQPAGGWIPELILRDTNEPVQDHLNRCSGTAPATLVRRSS